MLTEVSRGSGPVAAARLQLGSRAPARHEALRRAAWGAKPARRAGLGARQEAVCQGVAAPAASPALDAFQRVQSEAEFFSVLQGAVEGGSLPKPLLPGFRDFYTNYRTAVTGSGVPGSDERRVAQIMGSIADRVCVQFRDPYVFPSRHSRLLEPYNYYQFGQAYVSLLIDFPHSLLGGAPHFRAVAAALERGENVVLLANHQTEADPAVWALLLEGLTPRLATDVAYVAGDRVVTDPLCKPFSMGRNLFCVHSRKRMHDFPELVEEKQRTNRRTLAAMVKALREGHWHPAEFDPAVVGLMSGLLAGAKRPGHLYPLAMHSADIMPPPPAAEKVLGERRLTTFAPVGIALGEELVLPAKGASEAEQKALEAELTRAAYSAVAGQYEALRGAMRAKAAGEATPEGYEQPWVQ